MEQKKKQKEKNDATPLHLASNNGHLETVKYLVENGAEIEGRQNNNATPLVCAFMNKHNEIVKYLVEKGAQMYFVFHT